MVACKAPLVSKGKGNLAPMSSLTKELMTVTPETLLQLVLPSLRRALSFAVSAICFSSSGHFQCSLF